MNNQSILKKQVFIIRGRDLEAYKELKKFINALGLEVLDFDFISNQLGPNPFIADIVLKGIEKADAIIALFTPDEHAARYGKRDPSDKSDERYLVEVEGETRWQARSNVLFEAGVAYGTRQKQTVLVTLGTDVRLFSDVLGQHFVQLDEADGKERLRSKLEAVLGPVTPIDNNWERPETSGDFKSCLRVRWKFYDDIGRLEGHFRARRIGSVPNYILLDVVAAVACENPTLDWKSLEVQDFMNAIKRKFSWEVANDAYW